MTRQERSRQFRAALRTLTRREREVLALRCKGDSNKQVADQLFLSEQTIKNHIFYVLRKMGPAVDRSRPWAVGTLCWRLGYEMALLDVQKGAVDLEDAA